MTVRTRATFATSGVHDEENLAGADDPRGHAHEPRLSFCQDTG